uniref:Zinc finger RNA-binding protein-like n=1 Tax=Dermatophagoides pteronyssinus TaxID=6956 RepID=A0A6P6YKU6_DERPT|nr:zinc finger RNA-binding protein-like [Dermatophagoides pteronyssinus]
MLNPQQSTQQPSVIPNLTTTTMTTINNNPIGLSVTSGGQTQFVSQIQPIAQQTPQPYTYYQQTAIYPLPYSYMSTAVASTSSATSIYPTAAIIQQQQQQQQTIPVSTAPASVNNNAAYAAYAAQFAQYQAYQQQYAAIIAATSSTPSIVTPTTISVVANPMIQFQQRPTAPPPPPPPMMFQPTTMMSPDAYYPNPSNVNASTPMVMMPVSNVNTTTLQAPQILPNTPRTAMISSSVTSHINSTANVELNSPKFSTKSETLIDNSDKKSNYFCQTCQLVCSSSDSMMKHMSGFKHKKRVDFLRNNGMKKLVPKDSLENKKSINNRGPTIMSVILKCRICDVPCVSIDSYSSHLKGQRHNRSIGYRRKMGEEFFSNIPEILSKNVSIELETKIKELFGDKNSQHNDVQQQQADQMKSRSIMNVGEQTSNLDRMTINETSESPSSSSSTLSKMQHEIKDFFDCKPIGQDFIEEVLNQNGKIISFTCTLCECRFNDLNAKNLHLKGRRHRLQYKKKVDPNLIVEFIKSDMIKIENEKLERIRQKERLMKKILHTKPYLTEDLDPFRSIEKSKEFVTIFKYNQNNVHSTSIHSSSLKGKDYTRSFSDYLLEYRHHLIQPTKFELEYIYQTAYLVEKAIRNVGRFIELNFLLPIPVPKILSVHKTLLPMDTIEDMLENNSENRIISNDSRVVDFIRVVRPGPLGKGLLITEEKYFQLIILSSILPTESLLKLFERLVPKEIERLSKNPDDYPGEYHVQSELMLDETKFRISLYTFTLNSSSGGNEPIIQDDSKRILRFDCYLTCPYIRDESEQELCENVSDLLNREKCLRSLDDIKHFRWFKDMGIRHNFFTFTLRILRDLTKRVDIWSNVTLYTFEVILERILISANCCLGPASLFRHFFEFIAHGIMMTNFQGLADPCEARLTNIFNYLNRQDKEDITCSAQHLVRLVALRQLDKVLNVDSKIVYQIRMNELKQASNFQSRQPQLTPSYHQQQQSTSSTYYDNQYRYKSKPNYDRSKSSSSSSTTTVDIDKNSQQKQLQQQQQLLEQQQQLLEQQQQELKKLQKQQQQQQKSDDKNVSLKRKLSTDDLFEEPDLE